MREEAENKEQLNSDSSPTTDIPWELSEKDSFDADVDELVMRYIAKHRKHELAQKYEYYEQQARENPVDLSSLEQKIHEMCREADNNTQIVHRQRARRKVLSVIAALLIIVLACPTVAFAVSPTFRNYVYQFMLEWKEDHVSVRTYTDTDEIDNGVMVYAPTWIPDGFELVLEEKDPFVTEIKYENNDSFIGLLITDDTIKIDVDEERNIISDSCNVNDYPAVLTQEADCYSLVWQNEEANFNVMSNLSIEEIIKFAEGIKK